MAKTKKDDQTPSVRSQIKTLGANGNLGKKELLKISNTSNVNSDRIIRQLDKVNTKYADNKVAPIGLGAAAANSYVRQPRTIGGGAGEGPIASALRQMMPTYTPMRQGQGGYSTPGMKVPKGQQVFGSFNGAPQLQIKPAWNANAGFASPRSTDTGTGTGTTTNGVSNTGSIDSGGAAMSPILPEETTQDPIGMMSGGGAGINGATGIRRKKSSWKTQGLSTKGTSTQNRSLTINSFNV